jgi:hypothetical protein
MRDISCTNTRIRAEVADASRPLNSPAGLNDLMHRLSISEDDMVVKACAIRREDRVVQCPAFFPLTQGLSGLL